MTQVVVRANLPQSRFLSLPNKFKAFVSGFGGGKTHIGATGICIHTWMHPGVNSGYFAPTYPQIRDIFYPTIEKVAFDIGLNIKINQGNKEVHYYSGKKYRSTTICRSLDRPESIIGFEIGHGMIDEFDVMKLVKAMESWRKIIARMRNNDGGLRNGIDVTTTPEGFKATHKIFVQDVQEKPELAENYGLVQASTYDNEANLPSDYIPSLIETYPSELISAYINGQFTNLQSGTVYRNYDRVRNGSNETIRDRETLSIGMDFNVQHMAASIFVDRANGWHAASELKELLDTPDMIRAIKERWSDHNIIVYPDASGIARKTIGASQSDISMLAAAGFAIRARNRNPMVRDRINSVNKQFETQKLYVNARTAPTIARCLEQQAYDDNGDPDKKSGFDHQNDSFGYPVAYEFPVIKPGSQQEMF